MSKPMCDQGCGKPAFAELGNQLLCVDCLTKIQTAWAEVEKAKAIRKQQYAARMNYLEDVTASITGLPRMTNPIRIPTIPSGPTTYNHIRLDNSTVGAINTGNVKTIDVNLTQLHQAGNDKASEALQALTQAILQDQSLQNSQRNELIEQVVFLTTQATTAPAKRQQKAMAKMSNSL